jgi:hypothetical protein
MAISVFLSRPQPINPQQQAFIDKLSSWLAVHDLQARTLGVTDYSEEAPLEAIRALMAECSGLLCVAFRRTLIKDGERFVRAGRRFESRDVKHQWLTSPWAHIEPAMAYQIGLPILVLRESGVIDDGVLEKGIIGLYMPEFDLEDQDSEHFLEGKEWAVIGKRWEGHVRNVVANKGKPPKLY